MHAGVPLPDPSPVHTRSHFVKIASLAGPVELRRYLRGSGIPAVPYHIILWKPSPAVDLLAVVAFGGELTVFQIEAKAVSLKKVFHDEEAFPVGVVGANVDSRGELLVLSAGEECWVVSRACCSS